MKPNIDISVIIVTYNTKNMTNECINSIVDQTKDVNYEIILVDNASTDGSKEFFEQDSRIHYIYSPENLGFGRANNAGILVSKGQYLFLLNSDTILLNNAIKIFFDKSQQMGNDVALGGILKDKDLAPTHSFVPFFPTFLTELRYVMNSYLMRIPFQKNDIHEDKMVQSTINVAYITGADLFMHRSIIERVGLFDARFFMYFEETDLQYRMYLQNIQRKIIVGPEIKHLCGGSMTESKKHNAARIMLLTKSRFIYLRKYSKSIILYKLFRIAYFGLRFFPILFNTYSFHDKMKSYKFLIAAR